MVKRIALILALTLPLAGCVTSLEGALQVIDAASRIYNAVKQGVDSTRIAIDQECLAVSNMLTQVDQIAASSGASCNIKRAVNKYASRVSTYCNDPNKINSASLKAVLSTVQQAKADANAVIAAGCS